MSTRLRNRGIRALLSFLACLVFPYASALSQDGDLPWTKADAKNAIRELQSTEQTIARLDQTMKKVVEEAANVQSEIDQHNANRCVEHNPGDCASYDAEATTLNERMRSYEAQYETAKTDKKYAEARIGFIKAKLKITGLLNCAESFAAQLNSCATIWDPISAKKCQDRVWSQVESSTCGGPAS